MTFNNATYRGYLRKYNLKVYPRNTFNKEKADIIIEQGGRSRLFQADLYFVRFRRIPELPLTTEEMALIVSAGNMPYGFGQYHGIYADRYEIYYKDYKKGEKNVIK